LPILCLAKLPVQKPTGRAFQTYINHEPDPRHLVFSPFHPENLTVSLVPVQHSQMPATVTELAMETEPLAETEGAINERRLHTIRETTLTLTLEASLVQGEIDTLGPDTRQGEARDKHIQLKKRIQNIYERIAAYDG
jgi:hypothetical protein